jgi:hypothetical protein
VRLAEVTAAFGKRSGLLRALVYIGLRQSLVVLVARSSPRILPGAISGL